MLLAEGTGHSKRNVMTRSFVGTSEESLAPVQMALHYQRGAIQSDHTETGLPTLVTTSDIYTTTSS